MPQAFTWTIGLRISFPENYLLFAGIVQSPLNQVAPTFSPHAFRFLSLYHFSLSASFHIGCKLQQQVTNHDFPTGGGSYGQGA